jgi:hypothetical protein
LVHSRLVDVGGQRSERRKWIHCFAGVTAILFCCAISEYDQFLYEDETVNRMEESLRLFKDVCNSEWFDYTSVILFLNKDDIFTEKLARLDLTVCKVFADYQGSQLVQSFPPFFFFFFAHSTTGGKNHDAAIAYIKHKFCEQCAKSKQIYFHITTATNTNNIQAVFISVKDILVSQSLMKIGVL